MWHHPPRGCVGWVVWCRGTGGGGGGIFLVGRSPCPALPGPPCTASCQTRHWTITCPSAWTSSGTMRCAARRACGVGTVARSTRCTTPHWVPPLSPSPVALLVAPGPSLSTGHPPLLCTSQPLRSPCWEVVRWSLGPLAPPPPLSARGFAYTPCPLWQRRLVLGACRSGSRRSRARWQGRCTVAQMPRYVPLLPHQQVHAWAWACAYVSLAGVVSVCCPRL
jgi:hypothetical protein